jgi:hypothetical protein
VSDKVHENEICYIGHKKMSTLFTYTSKFQILKFHEMSMALLRGAYQNLIAGAVPVVALLQSGSRGDPLVPNGSI